MSLPTEKVQLRRSLLRARQSIPVDQWRHQSDRICHHLSDWPSFQQAQTVLAYFSFRQEPDLSPLFALPKRWGFPRCGDQEITWHQWSPPGADPTAAPPLPIGAHGIVEPHAEAPKLHSNEVDLILVPAVACDRQGYRLGYGGGYYDRMFSQPAWAGKPTVGILFHEAQLPQLPRDPWDKPLQAMCTEAGLVLSQN